MSFGRIELIVFMSLYLIDLLSEIPMNFESSVNLTIDLIDSNKNIVETTTLIEIYSIWLTLFR